MAKRRGGGGKPAKGTNSDRQNGKASKKYPKEFDVEKRRLVTKIK
jgi:hypothetical protein